QPGEHVAQVIVRIDSMAAAGGNDRVEDRRAVARVRMADEQPVFLSNRRGPDGVFHKVVVDLGVTEPAMRREALPLIKKIETGFSQQRVREGSLLEFFGGALEQLESQAEVRASQARSQSRTGLAALFPFALITIEM